MISGLWAMAELAIARVQAAATSPAARGAGRASPGHSDEVGGCALVGGGEAENLAADAGVLLLVSPGASGDESKQRKAGQYLRPGMNRDVGGVTDLCRQCQHDGDEWPQGGLRFHDGLLPSFSQGGGQVRPPAQLICVAASRLGRQFPRERPFAFGGGCSSGAVAPPPSAWAYERAEATRAHFRSREATMRCLMTAINT